jgi:hypothetical protein
MASMRQHSLPFSVELLDLVEIEIIWEETGGMTQKKMVQPTTRRHQE